MSVGQHSILELRVFFQAHVVAGSRIHLLMVVELRAPCLADCYLGTGSHLQVLATQPLHGPSHNKVIFFISRPEKDIPFML